MKMFAIYDSKAGTYSSPMPANTDGIALRNFEQIFRDETTSISQYPADFTLFCIGEYDEETGFFTQDGPHYNLGNALQFERLHQLQEVLAGKDNPVQKDRGITNGTKAGEVPA